MAFQALGGTIRELADIDRRVPRLLAIIQNQRQYRRQFAVTGQHSLPDQLLVEQLSSPDFSRVAAVGHP